jgi:hypothetical protein
MTDPKRLSEGGAGDFERLLLSSSADDQASPEVLQRIVTGMRAMPVGSQLPHGVQRLHFAAHTATAGAKIVASLAIATTLCVYGLRHTSAPKQTASPAPPRATLSAPEVPVPPPPLVQPTAQPAREPTPAARPAASAPTKRKHIVRTPPAPAPQAAAATTPSEPPPGPIEQTESQLLDEALGLLRAHQPQASLVRLDHYEHAFPQGTLRVEAALLKARALVLAGERERAAAFAADFLATHAIDPKSMSGRALGAFCNKP